MGWKSKGSQNPRAKTRQTSMVIQRFAKYGLATSGGMAFFILASPLLTRLYGPADFGVFGIYAVVVALLGIISAFRFDLAVLLPEEDRQAWSVVTLCFVAIGALGALAAIILGLSYVFIPSLRQIMPGELVWSIPIGGPLAGAYSALTYWQIRRRRYDALGWSKLTQGGVAAACQVGFGVWMGPVGLILGDLIGRVFALAVLSAVSLRNRPADGHFAWSEIRSAARRYGSFARVATPSATINALGTMAPTVLVASLYGATATGLFTLGQRMIATPSMLVGEAAAQVYAGEAAEVIRRDPRALKSLVARASLWLALVAVPVVAALAFGGPAVFSFVFGSEWADAGSLARFLALGFAAQFIVAPISQTLNLLELQAWQFRWDVFRLIAVAASIVLAAQAGAGIEVAVLALSIAMLASYAILWMISWTAARRHSAGALRPDAGPQIAGGL